MFDKNAFRDMHHNKIRSLGYWDAPREKGTLLMLMVTEIAKLSDSSRLNKAEKLADLALRVYDYCGYYKIDLSDLPPIDEGSTTNMVIELSGELEADRVGMGKMFGSGVKKVLAMAYGYAEYYGIDLSGEMLKKFKILDDIKKRKY